MTALIHLGWYKQAQLSNFLTQHGYDPQFIQHVSTLPKNIQKAIGSILNSHGKLPQDQLLYEANKLGKTMPQTTKVKQFIDQRFKSEADKQNFFAQIPIEYKQWVTKLLNQPNFAFIAGEDDHRLLEALKGFSELKNRTDLEFERDINQYRNLTDLEEVVELYKGTGSKTGGYLQYNPLKLPGVELIEQYDTNKQLYKISNADSLAKLGLGTKWCTREDYGSSNYASRYISQYGYIYIVVENNKPFVQFTPDFAQVMDVNDNDTPLPPELFERFGERYSKKINVPLEVLTLFSTEESRSDKDLFLSTMEKYRGKGEIAKIFNFADKELKKDPQFAVKALVAGAQATYFADLYHDDGWVGEAFTSIASRLEGEYSYDDVDDDDELEEAIFGRENFGEYIPLRNWEIAEPYKEIMRKFERRSRDGQCTGEHNRCADVLGKAAVISFRDNGLNIEDPKRLLHSVVWKDKKYKTYEEASAEDKIRYLAQAIDKWDNIGFMGRQQMENYQEYPLEFDVELENEPEPDADDFEDDDEYQKAFSEWEERRDAARDEQEEYYYDNYLPFCFDREILNSIKKYIVRYNVQLPSWLTEIFDKNPNNAPFIYYIFKDAYREKQASSNNRNTFSARKTYWKLL